MDNLQNKLHNIDDTSLYLHMFLFILSVDPCASSPCKNGGVCHKNGQKYVCKCPKGYQGKHCEKKRKATKSAHVVQKR